MNINRLTHRNRRKSRRGVNAVEFALTAPILFFLIMATMDFGWYFAHMLLLESATTHAARVAALTVGSSDLTAYSAPATAGQTAWTSYGLPGDAEFTMNLQENVGTGNVDMVEVTGSVPYNSFGVWDKILGDITALPSTIDVTVSRRLENQI